MALYKNNCSENSRVGYTVKIDTKDPTAIVYSSPNDTNVIGIITQSVPKYAQCEVTTSGVTNVYCAEMVVQGSIIRASKSTDNISRGTCKVAKITDTPYFKIGTSLESGKGLIKCVLHLSYSGGGIAVTNGTYTVGFGMITDGTITIENGIITAIQEAT